MNLQIGKTEAVIADETITMVRRSPLFANEEATGSYIFSFSVYLTEELKKELQYPNRPGSNTKQLKKEATLQLKGWLFSGMATITEATDETLKVYLPTYNSQLASKQRHHSLNDLDMGEEIKTHEVFTEGRIFNFNNTGWAIWNPLPPQGQINTGPLPFTKTTDPDNNWIDGRHFLTGKSGLYTIIFNLNLAVSWGNNFKLVMRKNNLPLIEKQINLKYPPRFSPLNNDHPATGFFAENGSTTIEVLINLNFSDSVSFWITSRADQDGHFRRLDFRLRPSTSFGFYHNDLIRANCFRTYPETNHATFSIHNPGFYNDAPQNKFLVAGKNLKDTNVKIPVINYSEFGAFPRTITRVHEGETYTIHNTIVPFPYIAAIIKAIIKKTNTTIIGENPFERVHFRRMVLVTMTAINRWNDNGFGTIPAKFNLSSVLPSINMATFFPELCQSLGITYDYNPTDNTIKFSCLDTIMQDRTSVEFSNAIIEKPTLKTDLFDGYNVRFRQPDCAYYKEHARPLSEINLKGEVEALSNLPHWNNTVNDCYLVRAEEAYFYWNWDDTTEAMGWIFFGSLFRPAITKGKKNDESKIYEHELPIAPVLNFNKPTDPTYEHTSRTYTIAAINTPGKMEGLKPVENQDYRLAIYAGMVMDGDGEGFLYPKGGPDAPPNPLNDPDLKTISLHLTDAPGSFFTEILKNYVEWRTKTPGIYSLTKKMTAFELSQINILRWHNVKGTDYLIKEIRATVGKNNLVTAEFDLISRNTLE